MQRLKDNRIHALVGHVRLVNLLIKNMNQEILKKIQAEYILLEESRIKLNTAFKKIEIELPVSTPRKEALDEAYHAIVKNMGVIAQLIKEGL